MSPIWWNSYTPCIRAEYCTPLWDLHNRPGMSAEEPHKGVYSLTSSVGYSGQQTTITSRGSGHLSGSLCVRRGYPTARKTSSNSLQSDGDSPIHPLSVDSGMWTGS